MPNVFEFESYKGILIELIKENSNVRGFQSHLAKAARCQASYLSQVLNSHIELTPDHAMGIAGFLQMDEDETDYFLNLVHYSRAGLPGLREALEKKLQRARTARRNLSRRISKVESSAQDRDFYYSSWIYLATHFAIQIPALQDEEALAERLSVDRKLVARALRQLHRHGLAALKNGKWIPLKNESHLSSESYMTEVNHANWRARALLDVQNNGADWIHYTSVFTMSRKDAELLRELVLKFISESRRIVHPSPDEDVFCLLTDFFPI